MKSKPHSGKLAFTLKGRGYIVSEKKENIRNF